MRIGPAPLLPLSPIQPDRTVQYPKALGAEFVGNPRLKFPEVKAKAPEPLDLPSKGLKPWNANATGGLSGLQALESPKAELPGVRGALPQLPAPRSVAEPSGPLGSRVDLLA